MYPVHALILSRFNHNHSSLQSGTALTGVLVVELETLFIMVSLPI